MALLIRAAITHQLGNDTEVIVLLKRAEADAEAADMADHAAAAQLRRGGLLGSEACEIRRDRRSRFHELLEIKDSKSRALGTLCQRRCRPSGSNNLCCNSSEVSASRSGFARDISSDLVMLHPDSGT